MGCVLLLVVLQIAPDIFFYIPLLGTTEDLPRQLNSRRSSAAENKHQGNLKKDGDEVVHMKDNEVLSRTLVTSPESSVPVVENLGKDYRNSLLCMMNLKIKPKEN